MNTEMAFVMLVAQMIVTAGAMWALVCRLAKMSKATLPEVRRQHAWLLGMLALSGAARLQGSAEASGLLAIIGVLVFLAYSTHRWAEVPQDAASKPMELDEARLVHGVGGRGE